MATAAKSGFGTTISVATNLVGETTITGPEMTSDSLDATTHSSTGAWREFINGLKTGGEVTLEGNYIPSDVGQSAIQTAFGSGAPVAVVITLPSSLGTTSFSAIVTAWARQASHDDIVKFTATLTSTGVVTET